MDLNEIMVFARVVQSGSFTKAAAELGMPKSTVSRKVSQLEERLHARLLQRTTRKLNLTDVGRTYYDYCARIIGDVEEAERTVGSLQGSPRGLLRVTAPINMTFLGPIVSDFLERYPDVRLELFCTGRAVDLVEERFDLGIRAGALADSTLIARGLGSAKWFLVGAPVYFQRRGRPVTPEDLKGHACLLFGTGPSVGELTLEREAPPARRARSSRSAIPTAHLSLSARVLVNDMEILHTVTIAGLGIALLPAFLCAEDLRAGRLERVLSGWKVPPTPVHVVYPSARHLSPAVRSFIDHLQERLTPPPWELDSTP